MIWGGWESFMYSLSYGGERSSSIWRPYIWPIKLIMLFGLSLMLLQSISEFFKDIFPDWSNISIDYNWRGLIAMSQKLTPSIGKLENEDNNLLGQQELGVQLGAVSFHPHDEKAQHAILVDKCFLSLASFLSPSTSL